MRLSIPPFLSWVMMSQSGITEEMSTASYYRLLGAMDDILTHDTEHGQAYRSSPGISREMLDSGYLRQEEGRAPSYQWFNIDKILDIIDGDHGADLVHRDLLVDCHETMNEIFRIVQALLSCYLPLSSPASDHPLIRKIWGAFYSMTNVSFHTSTFFCR